MLTILQLVKLYSFGVDLRIYDRKHPRGWKGEWDPSNLEASVYLLHNDSPEDAHITSIHELIHARNDFLFDIPIEEEAIESEALQTYQRARYVVEFMKWLYEIK